MLRVLLMSKNSFLKSCLHWLFSGLKFAYFRVMVGCTPNESHKLSLRRIFGQANKIFRQNDRVVNSNYTFPPESVNVSTLQTDKPKFKYWNQSSIYWWLLNLIVISHFKNFNILRCQNLGSLITVPRIRNSLFVMFSHDFQVWVFLLIIWINLNPESRC